MSLQFSIDGCQLDIHAGSPEPPYPHHQEQLCGIAPKSYFPPAERLSPFKFYQYLLTNTTDKDVIKFLRKLTFLPLEEINCLETEMQAEGYKPNTAQTILAREVTRFVHGAEGLKQAESATQVKPL